MNTAFTPSGDDPVARAYQRFLQETGVENEFLDTRAQKHRSAIAERKATALELQSRAAEVDAGRLERAADPHKRKRLSFGAGLSVATALALFDSLAAYLAAQAFGQDLPTTVAITALLVGALAFVMWVVNHFMEEEAA